LGAIVFLDEALTYAGTFTAGAGSFFDLNGFNLTLRGATTLSGAAIGGTGRLFAKGATAISGGATIGGTQGMTTSAMVTVAGGDVTLGDNLGDKAKLVNASTGTWDLTDDSGVAFGFSTLSTIVNAGVLEKTGFVTNAGSVIAPRITNTGKIEAAAGKLDLQGAISGTGDDIVSGASTLEFGSSVANGQTVSFTGAGGALKLSDPHAFAATISGFDTGGATTGTLELNRVWTYAGFTENAGHTEGTMAFADGAKTASVLFAGNYDSALFHAATNSSGTLVSYG
jgi:hypothetical protein